MGEMFSMDKTGDTKTIWDPENEDEVEAAENSFNDLVDKGYSAFKVKAAGRKGARMDKFDPAAGKVIMVPHLQGG